MPVDVDSDTLANLHLAGDPCITLRASMALARPDVSSGATPPPDASRAGTRELGRPDNCRGEECDATIRLADLQAWLCTRPHAPTQKLNEMYIDTSLHSVCGLRLMPHQVCCHMCSCNVLFSKAAYCRAHPCDISTQSN
eukprot:jgi/Mesen1/1673/ME000137S00589